MSLCFDPDAIAWPRAHFIGGERVPAASGLDLRRPSDGVGFAECPVAGPDMVDRAVAAAQTALRISGWCGMEPRLRKRALHRWADLVDQEAETLARLEAVASTRPITEAMAIDVPITTEQIRFFAEFADKEGGSLAPTGSDSFGMVALEPHGVVGAITPWNFPLSMAAWKLAPALAAGNAVVIKPSEMTPFSTILLAELSVRAGLPAGLINVVLGDGATTGNAITGHPGIAKVSFTGSTAAGAAIMSNVARCGIRPMTLELGGKSPQLVFADADLDVAAGAIARSILGNSGQACVAGSRLVVAEAVAEPLLERIAAHMVEVRPGVTWDEATRYSPIISERQISRIEGIVDAAVAAGAERRLGGHRLDRSGYFYAPTLLTGIAPDSPAVREEIFGPVLTVQTFHEDEEGITLAEHPTYGLCAGLFTRDFGRAMRAVRRLQAGTVWVNRYGRSRDHILPTGGYKQSGIGKDLGREAFLANCRSKSVLAAL